MQDKTEQVMNKVVERQTLLVKETRMCLKTSQELRMLSRSPDSKITNPQCRDSRFAICQ